MIAPDFPRFEFKYTVQNVLEDGSTGGYRIDYIPFLPCRLSCGTSERVAVDALLDSGADGVVLPLTLAKHLGLVLQEGPAMMVAGGEPVESYRSRVDIELGRGGRYSPPFKDVTVSIPKHGNPPPLIGRSPVFERYIVTIIEPEKRFILEPYRAK